GASSFLTELATAPAPTRARRPLTDVRSLTTSAAHMGGGARPRGIQATFEKRSRTIFQYDALRWHGGGYGTASPGSDKPRRRWRGGGPLHGAAGAGIPGAGG